VTAFPIHAEADHLHAQWKVGWQAGWPQRDNSRNLSVSGELDG
jgi:hypothetical protein